MVKTLLITVLVFSVFACLALEKEAQPPPIDVTKFEKREGRGQRGEVTHRGERKQRENVRRHDIQTNVPPPLDDAQPDEW